MKYHSFDIKKIDNDSAFVIVSECFRNEINSWIEERGTEDPEDHEGLTFTSWADWVSEVKDTTGDEVRTLLGKMDLKSTVEEPARKRAHTST